MHSFEGSHSTVPPKKQFYSKEISRGLVTEASAIRAEHEQMLLSLENQHKAALLLAQKAKLDLEANVHAKTAANKALAEALEISKADATNAAQTKESIRTNALGEIQERLAFFQTAKKEADDAAISAKSAAKAERETMARQLDEKNYALSSASHEIARRDIQLKSLSAEWEELQDRYEQDLAFLKSKHEGEREEFAKRLEVDMQDKLNMGRARLHANNRQRDARLQTLEKEVEAAIRENNMLREQRDGAVMDNLTLRKQLDKAAQLSRLLRQMMTSLERSGEIAGNKLARSMGLEM